MINILTSLFHLEEGWCFPELIKRIQSGMKVAIIAFSFRDMEIRSADEWQNYYGYRHGLYYDDMVKPLLAYGIAESNITWINYYEDSPKTAQAKIHKADILCLPGGLPDQLFARINEFCLLDSIREHDGIVMGFSAGALVQLEQYLLSPDEDYQTYSCLEGCGLICDFGIEVHYKQSPAQNKSIRQFIFETNKPVYAIADNGGLIVETKNITIMGNVRYFPNMVK